MMAAAPVLILTGGLMISCSSLRNGNSSAGEPSGNAIMAEANKKNPDTRAVDSLIPFVVVEQMPLFPGGDSALIAYISGHTTYPESARTRKAEGRVIVKFCVMKDGSVGIPDVIRGVDPDLDAEAIKMVRSLPSFSPGKQGGKTVPVWYMVPVEFKLR